MVNSAAEQETIKEWMYSFAGAFSICNVSMKVNFLYIHLYHYHLPFTVLGLFQTDKIYGKT